MSEAILRTKLTGDSAELQRSLREGVDAAKEFADRFKDSIRETLVEVTGLVLGVESIKEALEKTYEGVKGVFDLSRDLRNLSNQTGASVRDLVQLRAQFDLSGIAADNVGGILNRMQRTIEQASDKGGPLADVFYRLGLNIYDLQQMNPAAQFETLRQRLTAIEDPARRAQLAMKIFGNFGGGGSVLSIFGNAKIAQEAAEAISEQADILARNAATFQDVSINMEEAGIRLEGFFVGMAEPISRVILPVLEELNSLDLAKLGGQIGEGIADSVRVLFNAFKEGGLGDVLDTAFRAAITGFASGFTDVLVGAADSFIGEMMKVLQPLGDGMHALFNSVASDLIQHLANAVGMVPGMEGIAARINSDVGPITSEGIKMQRIQDWRDQMLKSLGLDSFDPNGPGPTAGQLQVMNQINKSMYDPGSGIGGNSANDFQQIGADLLRKGSAAFGKPFEDAMNQLLAKYGGKIPGEGSPNTPAQGNGGLITPEDMGLGRGENITGIHHGATGWQGSYAWAAGPIDIETGMAGRAGRVTTGPQTIEQNTAQTVGILTQIHSQLANVVAPS